MVVEIRVLDKLFLFFHSLVQNPNAFFCSAGQQTMSSSS